MYIVLHIYSFQFRIKMHGLIEWVQNHLRSYLGKGEHFMQRTTRLFRYFLTFFTWHCTEPWIAAPIITQLAPTPSTDISVTLLNYCRLPYKCLHFVWVQLPLCPSTPSIWNIAKNKKGSKYHLQKNGKLNPHHWLIIEYNVFVYLYVLVLGNFPNFFFRVFFY